MNKDSKSKVKSYLVLGIAFITLATVLGIYMKFLGNPSLDMSLSYEIYSLINSSHSLHSFMLVISYSASVLAVGVYLLIMLIYVMVGTNKDDIRRRYLIITIIALILADVVVAILKFSLRIPRPPWAIESSGYTYPSGHVTRSSVLAILIPKVFGGKLGNYLMIITWVWVFLTCLSRVSLGAHYVIDVVGGVLTGVGSAALLLSIYEFLRTSVVIIREEATKCS